MWKLIFAVICALILLGVEDVGTGTGDLLVRILSYGDNFQMRAAVLTRIWSEGIQNLSDLIYELLSFHGEN